jgi:signal transduction histidine kinase
LEAGRVDVNLAVVDVAGLMAEVEDEARQIVEELGLRFECRVASDLPAVHTDRLKLRLILKNLIGNAIKFTSRGHVIVDCRAGGGGVEFVVQDTGGVENCEPVTARFSDYPILKRCHRTQTESCRPR